MGVGHGGWRSEPAGPLGPRRHTLSTELGQRHPGAGRDRRDAAVGVRASISRRMRHLPSRSTASLTGHLGGSDLRGDRGRPHGGPGCPHRCRSLGDPDLSEGERFQNTTGPIIADGKVINGINGYSQTVESCFVTAHDARTGRELWRTYTVACPGEPHGDTWGDLPLEERGGGGGCVERRELGSGAGAGALRDGPGEAPLAGEPRADCGRFDAVRELDVGPRRE